MWIPDVNTCFKNIQTLKTATIKLHLYWQRVLGNNSHFNSASMTFTSHLHTYLSCTLDPIGFSQFFWHAFPLLYFHIKNKIFTLLIKKRVCEIFNIKPAFSLQRPVRVFSYSSLKPVLFIQIEATFMDLRLFFSRRTCNHKPDGIYFFNSKQNCSYHLICQSPGFYALQLTRALVFLTQVVHWVVTHASKKKKEKQ